MFYALKATRDEEAKVKLKETDNLALERPPKPCRDLWIDCEYINYLLWEYGYLDKGFHLVTPSTPLTNNKTKFVDSLVYEWNRTDVAYEVVMTRDEWNKRF